MRLIVVEGGSNIIRADGKTPDGKWCRPKKSDPSRQVTSRLTMINIGDVVYIGTDTGCFERRISSSARGRIA